MWLFEEVEELEAALNDIEKALDNLENQNDNIHSRLKELLESNREIRKEMATLIASGGSATETGSSKTAADDLSSQTKQMSLDGAAEKEQTNGNKNTARLAPIKNPASSRSSNGKSNGNNK